MERERGIEREESGRGDEEREGDRKKGDRERWI